MTEGEMRQDTGTVEQIVDGMSLFDDGSHIIYVNGAYKGDDAIGYGRFFIAGRYVEMKRKAVRAFG